MKKLFFVENEQKAVWKFIYIGCREHLSVVSNYKKIKECGVCLERWVLKFESREKGFEACKRKGRLLIPEKGPLFLIFAA